MNGKRAKILHRLARRVIIDSGKDPMEGLNSYNQETNCNSWELAVDKDGIPIRDETGQTYMAPKKNPGTVHTAHTTHVVYKNLKKLWKVNPNSPVFRSYKEAPFDNRI